RGVAHRGGDRGPSGREHVRHPGRVRAAPLVPARPRPGRPRGAGRLPRTPRRAGRRRGEPEVPSGGPAGGAVRGRRPRPRRDARLAGARGHEIVRLETLAEQVAADGVDAARFAGEVRSRLDAQNAVGAKSVAAYRAGLELAGEPPSGPEVAAAAGRLMAQDRPRVCDEVLHRFLVFCAVGAGLPVQFHVGYGDVDADLRRGDPLLLIELLRAMDPVPAMLLHNYPFHRHAGYLAQVLPNVYVDAGLATHNLGYRAPALIAELLELAPFGKVLYSSDAFGLAELYHLGALLFRRGLAGFLAGGADDGAWTAGDAERVAALIASGNARRVYGI